MLRFLLLSFCLVSLAALSSATIGTVCTEGAVECTGPNEICGVAVDVGDRMCECNANFGENDGVCRAVCTNDDTACTATIETCGADIGGVKICECATGYANNAGTGVCEDTDECTDADPCVNGNCENEPPGSYTCTCTAGWTGTNCDADILECASDPCQNGGSCVEEVNSFTCNCDAGWTGDVCTTDILECGSTPCQNGGTCVEGVNSYTCTCDAGWTGDVCSTEILDICTGSPLTCPAGVENGECVGNDCVCKTGYTKEGETCVMNAAVSISKMSQSLLFFVCMAAVVFKRC